MANPTPGPWEWSDQELQPLGTQWSLTPGILIAEGNDGTPGGDKIDRANARLIAAAPDFAEAARRLLAVFDQQKMTTAERIIAGISDSALRTEGSAAIEALRAALSKATSTQGQEA